MANGVSGNIVAGSNISISNNSLIARINGEVFASCTMSSRYTRFAQLNLETGTMNTATSFNTSKDILVIFTSATDGSTIRFNSR